MWDACLDLALGSACAVCDVPGRALCRRCQRALPTRAGACWPTPTPVGLVRPSAVGDYAAPLRPLVLAHKEQGRLALARPLGRLLAVSVLDAWRAHESDPDPHGTVLGLVPVPSHAAVVRHRGHDPLLAMTRHAAASLRRHGVPARLVPLLRVRTRPGDQAGLDAEARATNVRGRFVVRSSGGGLVGPPPPGRSDRDQRGRAALHLVLVDDVITTGATLREAQRALEEHDLRPVGAAVVAATRRRSAPP